MAPYIALNQAKRTESKTEFEKDFFKLMNSSVFGKTCENQKKRTSAYLVHIRENFKKLVGKPNFMDARIFDEDFAGVELQKTKLVIKKKAVYRWLLHSGSGQAPHVSVRK
jgi:hypothetical protein